MLRPPRNPAIRLFSMVLIVPSVLYAVIDFALLLGLHIAMTYWGFAPDRVRTVLFFGLVASIMALVLVNRSFSPSLTRELWRNNALLRYMAAAVLEEWGLIHTMEPLRPTLHFSPPDPTDFLFLFFLLIL